MLPAAFLAAVVFLAASLSASAEISLKADKSVYNFGDSVVASYDFSRDQDFSGLVKLSLFCTNFDLEFYTLPTNVYAGEAQQVSVPPLSISKAMLGKCYVAANATSYDKSANDSATSNFFNVTSLVSVAVDLDSYSYLPGATVEISGRVGKSHSLPAGVVMTFLGADYASNVPDNAFAYSIKLPKDIKTGKHAIGFDVNDSYGNSGSASAEITIEAVPTRIVNGLSKQSVKPGEMFALSVEVYDQADDILPGDVSVSVADSAGSVVLTASNVTGTSMVLAFPAQQKPGSYLLKSSSHGLAASSKLVVEEVEQASVTFDNRTVVLKNTGNVDYAKKFNISLTGTRKNYVLAQNVNLAPGEVFAVDLTKAVMEDTYSVAFPTVTSAPPVESVLIEDNRDFLKKTSDAFGIPRTGRVITDSGTGSGKAQVKFAPLLLLVIVGVTAFYFVRNRGRSSASRSMGGDSGSHSAQPGPAAGGTPNPAAKTVFSEEDRIRQIIDEKRRQFASRVQEKPKSLRDDPVAQKFVRDMMKEKKFR